MRSRSSSQGTVDSSTDSFDCPTASTHSVDNMSADYTFFRAPRPELTNPPRTNDPPTLLPKPVSIPSPRSQSSWITHPGSRSPPTPTVISLSATQPKNVQSPVVGVPAPAVTEPSAIGLSVSDLPVCLASELFAGCYTGSWSPPPGCAGYDTRQSTMVQPETVQSPVIIRSADTPM